MLASSTCMAVGEPSIATLYLRHAGAAVEPVQLQLLARLGWGPGYEPDWTPWHEADATVVGRVREGLRAQGCGRSWGDRLLGVLRGIFAACLALGVGDPRRLDAAVEATRAPFAPTPAAPPPARTPASRLLAACQDGTATGFRDALILALHLVGLPTPDIIRLRTADVGRRTSRLPGFRGRRGARRRPLLLLAGILRVTSALGVVRYVKLTPAALQALRQWLRVRGRAPGRLICGLTRARRPVPHRGLRLATVAEIVRRRARQAGFGRMNPADLRREGLRARYAAGEDLRALCLAAGHARVRSTKRLLGLS